MDEYAQPDAPEESQSSPETGKTRRGSGGNRKAQVYRWRRRYPTKYRDYMKRYMRIKRAQARREACV